MKCIKCGRETRNSQVFCDQCLAGMADYPVKPNITVQLPVRSEPPAAKKRIRRHQYVRPEEILRHLQMKIKALTLVLVVTLVAFLAVSAMLLIILQNRDQGFDIGQNYNTESTQEFN